MLQHRYLSTLTTHHAREKVLHIVLETCDIVAFLDKLAGSYIVGLICSLLVKVALDATRIVSKSVGLWIWWYVL